MDDALRALERSAALGDPVAKERLARERERAGLEATAAILAELTLAEERLAAAPPPAFKDASNALLHRYLAALFREEPGLHAVALAGFLDAGGEVVGDVLLGDELHRAWRVGGLDGTCPTNALAPERERSLSAELLRFWPAQRQTHRAPWCLFARREPGWPRGIRLDRTAYRPDR